MGKNNDNNDQEGPTQKRMPLEASQCPGLNKYWLGMDRIFDHRIFGLILTFGRIPGIWSNIRTDTGYLAELHPEYWIIWHQKRPDYPTRSEV